MIGVFPSNANLMLSGVDLEWDRKAEHKSGSRLPQYDQILGVLTAIALQ